MIQKLISPILPLYPCRLRSCLAVNQSEACLHCTRNFSPRLRASFSLRPTEAKDGMVNTPLVMESTQNRTGA